MQVNLQKDVMSTQKTAWLEKKNDATLFKITIKSKGVAKNGYDGTSWWMYTIRVTVLLEYLDCTSLYELTELQSSLGTALYDGWSTITAIFSRFLHVVCLIEARTPEYLVFYCTKIDCAIFYQDWVSLISLLSHTYSNYQKASNLAKYQFSGWSRQQFTLYSCIGDTRLLFYYSSHLWPIVLNICIC